MTVQRSTEGAKEQDETEGHPCGPAPVRKGNQWWEEAGQMTWSRREHTLPHPQRATGMVAHHQILQLLRVTGPPASSLT